MIKKFGNEVMKERFKFYQDALRTAKELDALEKEDAVDENYNIPN
ncbi:hypothetical protein PF005_g8652 [Phytophthora fragariae]|nr:hypothetical protein PF011_g7919 [Phytophthora fragariae]KAE9021480.1 hypothetical protein PR002_g12237 [Phytophthora rubi]KAE9027809.1 hypothetical protein PR001_g11886 [Phytophthora rubi]KAE9217442.1 hypothetical protein PF005_g8652 [Phytophthora fragariae]KAE9314689.1 hypothetical protein PF001_g8149 [Phytophthora fragariae]